MRHGADPNRKREADGRYAVEQLCDLCGKPIHGRYGTDNEVCDGGDGPGFYLCSRKACWKKIEGKSPEQRRVMYTRRCT